MSNPLSSSDCPSRSSLFGLGSSAASGDRVNPFDKNVVVGGVSGSSSAVVGGQTNPSTSTLSFGVEPVKEEDPGTTLDDLIKNRFANKQGVQDEATGRYKPKLADAKAEPSFEEMKSELFRKEEKKPHRNWSESDSVFSSSISSSLSPKLSTDAKPSPSPGFGKFTRTNSSDAELIFGGTSPMPSARPKYNYSIDSQSSISSDADNIFGRKEDGRSFLKSLSVSSTDDREFSTDPRVKSYEGTSNSAFQDRDSALGSYRSTATGSTSSGTAESSAYKWSSTGRVAEEDYDDLK